jgi:hypothetical protein
MSYKYHLNVPASGAHKLARFVAWAADHAPKLAYNLPREVPIKTESLTVRLKSPADRQTLSAAFPATLP